MRRCLNQLNLLLKTAFLSYMLHEEQTFLSEPLIQLIFVISLVVISG